MANVCFLWSLQTGQTSEVARDLLMGRGLRYSKSSSLFGQNCHGIFIVSEDMAMDQVMGQVGRGLEMPNANAHIKQTKY